MAAARGWCTEGNNWLLCEKREKRTTKKQKNRFCDGFTKRGARNPNLLISPMAAARGWCTEGNNGLLCEKREKRTTKKQKNRYEES
ncbi:hypothetical protein DEO72_LG3g2102 [Vigna unguiculata]|uniref:Uncharacterized protein n=1 Tax=Vigna unguiculata TaxID=3917 RepID=A0A4D6LGW9_VIGUN|nr:hypothetical protein DEO72_LG3g2102 [Vigna unguiculata]